MAEGVIAQKDGTGKWVSTGQQNTMKISAQNYWNVVVTDKDNLVSSEMINDASYVSVREASLSYQIPSAKLSKTPFKKINFALYGRNLFYLRRFTDGYAPEASSFNVNNSSLGLESTSLPMLRNVGIKATLDF